MGESLLRMDKAALGLSGIFDSVVITFLDMGQAMVDSTSRL